MLVGMSIPITNPRQADLAAQYRPKDTTAPKTSRLDALMRNYLRSTPQVAQAAAETNIFNPFPSATEAVGQGRVPAGGELGLDAGFLAAGFLPVGKAASQLNSIVKRLNKSTDVRDFITPETMRNAARPNNANEGLFRPGAQSFDHKSVPEPASPYTFGLVPTEKLSPLREFDRAAEPVGRKYTGPDNLRKLAEHMAEGGKLSDPTGVAYYPDQQWGYLAEGNHRLALAEALGLEQIPTTVWRQQGLPLKLLFARNADGQAVGQRIGPLDTNQLRRDPFGDFPESVGERYVPPTMHPYLLKYFQPGQ
jgi:hypothetical protein